MKKHWPLWIIISAFLVTFSACGNAAPTSSANAQNVQVTLTDFAIQSSRTTFSIGTPYHFLITNNGHTTHEFMIMPPQSKEMSMGNMHDVALLHVDSIAIGEEKTLDFTFSHENVMKNDTSMNMNNFEFACHLPGHYEQGMKLPITIEP
jgi:uncharacterized cupredoxin-like copper-binding protein